MFPSDIVRIIFDHYYLIHGEWFRHNIHIQVVNAKEDDRKLYLHPPPSGSSLVGSGPKAIWRMYPKSECDGFILRPINQEQLNRGENVTEHTKFLGIYSKYFVAEKYNVHSGQQ